MQWIYLTVAGLLECCWAVSLKYSQGFTRVMPSVMTILGMVASFIFLSMALKHLPLGVAYAVWTGIGMVGTYVMGIVLFHESANAIQMACVGLILFGIIGLRLFTQSN